MASLQSVDEEHQQIYDCVVARDVKKTRALLASHISSVKKQVLAGLRLMLAEQEEPEI